MKISPTLPLFLLITFLLSSCTRDEKKEVREKWFTYFFALVVPKHPGIGTDSMIVDFQNHSDYPVDSVAMIFHNRGLLINSSDTLFAAHIPAGKSVKVPVPYHVLGVSHSVEFIYIHSQELEFCFKSNAARAQERDPYHCH